VAKPEWADPFDTTFSARSGGRWNPPGSFGVLYLNADERVASANARQWFAHNGGFSVLDLQPARRPVAVACTFRQELVDVVSPEGVAAIGLPSRYPWKVPRSDCQPIGERLHAAGERGIACRSAAECAGPRQSVGEEAALFDRGAPLVSPGAVLPFHAWYVVPTVMP
jgi:RES domain-containing protein